VVLVVLVEVEVEALALVVDFDRVVVQYDLLSRMGLMI
jgi:hypothetical protein